MADLHLELLGRPIVRRTGSDPAPVPLSLQSFLAFLSIEREAGCHRDRLIDSLWPDVPADQGRRRLNTAVWRSRNLFGGGRDGALVATRTGYIALDRTMLAIDIAPTIHALSTEGRAAAERGDVGAVEALRHAVLVDANQFLAGNYDEWAVQTRHQLEAAVVKGVETLLDVVSTPAETTAWAELLVRIDPLREDTHRRLIRLYADAGRRADALRQYEICVRHLRDDLGVEPLIETTLVATAIREGIDPLPANAPDPRRALCQLREALASCHLVLDHLEAAIAALPQD